MLLSYNLLNKYVNLKKTDPQDLAQRLTNAGLEVESVRDLAQGSDLVIGKVIEAKPHPDSKKLTVCQVDIKGETLQIVCGAPNVGADQKVIVAKPGCKLEYAKVPVIKEVELAGIKSSGMICSLSELGVPSKYLSAEQLSGIEVLDDEYQVGDEALSALKLDDHIIDIALTPNRSDIYSIYALAIEVAALLNTKVKKAPMNLEKTGKSAYQINIQDEACKAYGLFTIDNIKIEETPTELQNQLLASGYSSKNNIVDYANLAMLVSGNPIHVFDADKLNSMEFSITKGKTMKDFVGLDNNTYEITEDDLVIMNGDDIVAIAGVIGSQASAVDTNTQNIVIESAWFDHVSVRNTARRLDLYTEASIRFSKLINPYTLEFPIALLSKWLKQPIKTSIEVNYPKYQPTKIPVTQERLNSLLGIDIDLKKAQRILERLMFTVSSKAKGLDVKPPSYRQDVQLDVDVIEEIIRMYGYDNIPAKMPVQRITYEKLADLKVLQNNTRKLLQAMQLNEVISYQLSSAKLLDEFSDEKKYLKLANPLSEDRAVYRDQLLSSMVETLKYNKSYQNNDLALFEISNVADYKAQERSYLSLGLMGQYQSNPWLNADLKSDFYLIKGIIFNLMEQLGYPYGRYIIKEVESNHPYFHPTRAAYLMMGKETLGIFGELHPRLAQKHKLKNIYLGTFDLTTLSQNVPQSNKYQAVNHLPKVTRDLSMIVDDKVKAQDIIRVIKTGNNKLIKEVSIFDVYQGEKVGEGKYSISVKIVLQDAKETLTEEVVNTTIDKIVDNIATKLDATLRT